VRPPYSHFRQYKRLL